MFRPVMLNYTIYAFTGTMALVVYDMNWSYLYLYLARLRIYNII